MGKTALTQSVVTARSCGTSFSSFEAVCSPAFLTLT